MIYVAFLGTGNTGTFDIYSDSDNYTTPFEVNILKSEIENGFTSYNCPDDATEVRVLGDNLSCGFQPIIPISIADNQVFGMTGNTLIETDINTLCLNNSTNYKIMKGGYTPYLIVKKSNFIKTGVTTSGTFYDGLYSITYPYNSYNTCIKFGDSDLGIDLIDYIITACGYAPNPLPTPTPTPTPTITPTPTVTPTPTPTVTPTITPTPTSTPTPTPTPVPDLPTIITSGLTIYIDGSGSSYPGTGNKWFNRVTGTTITGATLSGSPTWNTSDNGFFTFDGVNDFGEASLGIISGSTSFGGWVKMTTGSTQEIIFQRGLGTIWNLFIAKETDNKFTFSIVTSTSTQIDCPAASTLTSGIWYYVVAKWTRGSSLKIYINGTISNTVAETSTTLRSGNLTTWYLSRSSTADYDESNIGDFEVYNRALSDAEVLSNFNAKKTLYGY